MSANNEIASNASENEVPSTPTVTPPIDIDDEFEDMVGYVAQHMISTLRSKMIVNNGRFVPCVFTSNPYLNPAASEMIPASVPISRYTDV